MKLFSRLTDRHFCAFCRSPRKVYVKKHVDLTNVVGSLFISAGMTFLFYGGPDPRGLMFFCLFIFASESLIQLRWRSSLVCRLCGFDPILYKKSPELAANRVREFYLEQAKNPSFLLSKSPLVDLHRQQVARERLRRRYEAVLRTPPSASSSPEKAPVVDPR